MPDKIAADRIYLERLRYEFAEEIFFAYASKPEATKYVAWPTHQSMEETRIYLAHAINGWKMGVDYSYVIRLKPTGQLIGSVGCINEMGRVQFGYIISPTFWNQGLATEACQVLLPKLILLQDVHRVWTFTDVDNHASQRVLLKSGLVEEARLTRWFRFVNQGNAVKDCVLFKLPDEFLAANLVSQ